MRLSPSLTTLPVAHRLAAKEVLDLPRSGKAKKLFSSALAAAVLAILVVLPSAPAQASIGGFNGPYKITISNIRFGFPTLNDCGFFGGQNCSTSQVEGDIALSVYDNYLGTNVDGIHLHTWWGWNVVAAKNYYPTNFGINYSDNTATPNTMRTTANLNNLITVEERFWDNDYVTDDILCSFGQFPSFNVYSILSAPNHSAEKVFTTPNNGDGSCSLAFTVTVS
jgi:hypothetical protein